jgi:hypothetical protein
MVSCDKLFLNLRTIFVNVHVNFSQTFLEVSRDLTNCICGSLKCKMISRCVFPSFIFHANVTKIRFTPIHNKESLI